MDVLLKKGLQSGNFRIFFEFTLEVSLSLFLSSLLLSHTRHPLCLSLSLRFFSFSSHSSLVCLSLPFRLSLHGA